MPRAPRPHRRCLTRHLARAPAIAASLLAVALFGSCWTGAAANAAPAAPADSTAPPASPTATGSAASAASASSDAGPTQIRFENVEFHVAPGVVLGIRHLRGDMTSKVVGGPVVLDDKRSFVIHIDSADVALDTASLARLMNEHVFGYPGAPLRRLAFATKDGQLVQRGTLHRVVDIPFELTAGVSVTPDGLIRIHPTAMRIFSVPGDGLMRALGLTLDGLLDLRGARGVRAEGNDPLLDPDRLLPPPTITGRLRAVRVEPGRLVQSFGDGGAAARRETLAPPDGDVPNYLYFRGGTLRFGKLLMIGADMQIVDLQPADPFDFSVDRYAEQLVAGYSRSLPDLGLEVFMPDLSTLGRDAARPGRVAGNRR